MKTRRTTASRRTGGLRLWLLGYLCANVVADSNPLNSMGSSRKNGMASAGCPSDLIVRNAEGYDTLRTCSAANQNTYPGSVTFLSYPVESATGAGTITALNLNPIEGILGSLTFSNINIQGFAIFATDMRQIAQGLTFENLEGFSLVSQWSNLKYIPSVTFNNVNFTGSSTFNLGEFLPSLAVEKLALTINETDVQTVEGFNDAGPPDLAIDATICYNTQLTVLSWTNVGSGSLIVANNDAQLNVDLPSFLSADALNISDASAFTADQMSRATSAAFTSNNFPTLSLPSLHYLGDNLYIADNSFLSNLSLPNLMNASTIKILDNLKLKDINLPSLRSASVLDVTSPVDSLSAPVLNNPGTSVNIDVLSQGTLTCPKDFSSLPNHTCTNGVVAPLPAATSLSPNATPQSSAGSSSGSTAGGLSSGAKIGIGVGIGVGVVLLVIVLVGFILARHRRRRTLSSPTTPSDYSKEQHFDRAQSPSYRKVPVATQREAAPAARPRSNKKNHNEELHELEEQQRERHEMDARSITNVDREEDALSRGIDNNYNNNNNNNSNDDDDDDEEDRRSLDEIERIHAGTR